MTSRGSNLIVKVDEYGAVVGTFDHRLDIAMFDPGQYPLCNEDVIYASAIVSFSRRDLGIPAYGIVAERRRVRKRISIKKAMARGSTRVLHVYIPFLPCQNDRTTSTMHPVGVSQLWNQDRAG